MVRSPFRYKKPPKDASVVRGVFHPPGSKKSPTKSDRGTANDGLKSAAPAAHEDEDEHSKQETGHQRADGRSQLPSNASGIVQRYLSPNAPKPRDAADAATSDASCSPHPPDSDKPSSTPRRAKIKSVYLGGRTIIGESPVPIASLQEPEPKTVKSRCSHRTAKDTRKRPRTCISSGDIQHRASTMSSLDSLPARSSEGGSPQVEEEDLEAGHCDEPSIDRQIVSAPCGFQTGVKRVSSADAAKKRRLSKRARTRLTMREVNTTVQPGRHYSSLESMAHLEKAKALTIPKTIDFFRRVEVKLIVVNTLLSALLTAFVLYAIPDAWQRNLAGSSPAVSVLGAFLSFALVFRTQTCYTRWWEARTQWGRMTSAVVNLAGQARAWFGDEDLADRFLAHCVVFPYACKAVLRGNQLHDPTEEGPRFLHSGMLTDADLGAIVRHGRPPFACLEILRRATHDALREENGCLLPPEMIHGAFLAMEHVLWELNLNFGACLKINGTRMPASYTVFVRSFVLFYFVLASLVWAPQIQWLTPVIVGYCLFLINTVLIIGDQMLKPFELQWGALPLQKFCTIMEHEIMNVPRRHADINCLFVS